MEAVNGAVTDTEMMENIPQIGAEVGNQQTEKVVHLDEILSLAQDSNAENPDAGAPEQAAEMVDTKQGDDSPEAAMEGDVQIDEPSSVYRTQAEFDAAFSKRMAKERSQLRPLADVGRAISQVAGGDLSPDEMRAAVAVAVADKRAKANHTDFDTELNNIRLEQRIAQRFAPKEIPEPDNAEPPANGGDVQARSSEMIGAIHTINDDGFTITALQENKQAMAAWVQGASPAQVYKQFFAGVAQPAVTPKPKRPAPERAANSGVTGRTSHKLSHEEMRKIDEAIERGETISVV